MPATPPVLSQDGYTDAGVFIESGTILIEESLAHVAGLVFSGMPPECRLESPALQITVSPTGGQVPCLVSVYAQGRVGSWGLPPAEALLDPTRDFLVGTAILTAPGSQSPTIALEPTGLNAARFIASPLPWDGNLALHLHTRTADHTSLQLTEASAVLSTTINERLFSGIEIDGPVTRLASSRPDMCPICGDETLRETWVYCPRHLRMECSHCVDWNDDEPKITEGEYELLGEDD